MTGITPVALVVQHHPADGPGAIARELCAKGVLLQGVHGYRGEPVPESIGEAAALVIMGGPMSASDDYPFLRAERRLIASAVEARVPILGVCLGAQLLASVLGGSVARGAGKEIGWFAVERAAGSNGDPLFDGLPPKFVPFHWHGDEIVLPPGATLLARSRLTEVQAFRADDDVYGVQFHLESDLPMVAEMVRSFGDELREAGLEGERILEEADGDGGGERDGYLRDQERLAGAVFGTWASRVVARTHT